MRGLRAPGRLEEVDPMVLRQRADEMDRDEILSKYTVVKDAAGVIDAYRPLVTDVGADVVSIQVAVDQAGRCDRHDRFRGPAGIAQTLKLSERHQT